MKLKILALGAAALRPYYAADLENNSFEVGGLVKFEVPPRPASAGGLPAPDGKVTA